MTNNTGDDVTHRVDVLVRRVVDIIPFDVEVFVDMAGPDVLQISLGRRGGIDDPPDSVSLDPYVEPVRWTFDVEGGRATFVSDLGVDATPEDVASWVVQLAIEHGSPAARALRS